MEGRVIASFRAVGGPGRPFLERARSLITRLTEIGGVHVGWDVLKITFAFEASRFPTVLEAAINPGPAVQGEEPAWAVGLAQGDIRPVNEPGSPLTSSGLLWWGPPIVAASALAELARPGEILCAQTIPALRSGDIVTSGLRIARDGTLRVRGARVDKRQPWKRQAAENLAKMTVPRLVTSHLPAVKLEPGALVVLRADPGSGGTRLLHELAQRAPRSLVISPAGSGFEPLGALRRALGRSAGKVVNPLLLELSQPLDALIKGKGVSLDLAARLITAFLWPKQSGTNSALILDDAKLIDPATLEACVRAVKRAPAFGVIARLDATGGLPSVLAGLPKASEHELPVLSREGAEDVAVGCTGGALDALARSRWARLGGGNPLAIVEAITQGIGSGDLTWTGDKATPRSRAAGRGKVRPAAKWIRKRANAEKTPVRAVLSLLAVVGGEAKIDFLSRVLEHAQLRIDAMQAVAYMIKARWIVSHEEGFVSFPARTHKDALFTTLEGDAKKRLHLAIARTIEETEGVFGRVEGAWHSAQGGEGPKAALALLDGARATAEAHLEASTTQLIAFARRADPSCEEVALEVLANALARSPSVNPPPMSMPPMTTPSAPPSAIIPSSRPGAGGLSRTGPERVAAIASVPPVRRVSNPPPAAPSPPDPEGDDDSMVEHARIVPPDTPVGTTAPIATAPATTNTTARSAALDDASVLRDEPTRKKGSGRDSEPPTMEDDVDAGHADSDPELVLRESQRRPAGVSAEPPMSAKTALAHATTEQMPAIPMMTPGAPGMQSEPPGSGSGSQIATRLGELAKEALLTSDNAALERWVDGLRAAGESPAFTERMRAMARLGRGDIGDALRVLRRTRAQLDAKDHRRRCQTSLALGVALSVAGRPQEALLEGMDALARARQINDDRGAKACLAFLAKLYSSVDREEEAAKIRSVSS